MSSEAVRGERGTCKKEIRDRAEHVPPTGLHHTTDRRRVMPAGFGTCDHTLSCRTLLHSYQKIWITSLPHFIRILCFYFRSSGRRRVLLLFVRILRRQRGPMVSNLSRASSSPSLKDLPFPFAPVSLRMFVFVIPY